MNTEELLKQENQKVLLGDVYSNYMRVDYIKNGKCILQCIEDEEHTMINNKYIENSALTQRGVYKNFQEITCPDGYEFTGEYRQIECGDIFLNNTGTNSIEFESGEYRLWKGCIRYILKKLADIPTPKPEDLPLGYRLGEQCELSRPLIYPLDLFYVLENSYAWKLIKIDVPKGFELVSNVERHFEKGEWFICKLTNVAIKSTVCSEYKRYILKKIETWRPVRGLEDIGKKARFKWYRSDDWIESTLDCVYSLSKHVYPYNAVNGNCYRYCEILED